jgi:hypothetical protein
MPMDYLIVSGKKGVTVAKVSPLSTTPPESSDEEAFITDDGEDTRPSPNADTVSAFSNPLPKSGADFENASDLCKCNSIDPAFPGIHCLSWHDGLTGYY